jgi:hypothetical protein
MKPISLWLECQETKTMKTTVEPSNREIHMWKGTRRFLQKRKLITKETKIKMKKRTTKTNIYREEEGPHPKLESGHASEELGYDGFYLGMTWYLWKMLPDIRTDLEPVDPTGEWVYADYYDKPMGWQAEIIACYSRDLHNWRMRNLQRIRNFNYEELKGWKLRYKQN